MLIHSNLMVLLCRTIIGFCHVLVSNFTLLRLVEFELVVDGWFIGNRGAGNTLIDLHPVLVTIGLLGKQSVLEGIPLDVECF